MGQLATRVYPIGTANFPAKTPRLYCCLVSLAQEDIEARGGRPWDTVKPLHKYFNALARVALVDDSGGCACASSASVQLV